ncbi:hypothetical protein LCGC14_2375150 [marine sediment metagenome]|uniref:Uncharacterized protein n=1 Tax=marine sediment metagenome TaxID=412755 RepID=A0A0F9C2N5_9ZZZZ
MKKIDRVETNAIEVFMDRSDRKNLYQEIDIRLKMIATLEDKINELVDEHNKLIINYKLHTVQVGKYLQEIAKHIDETKLEGKGEFK